MSTQTRAPLSRDRLLSTAAALADAEGLGAVTMRRLAAEVGVEAMSLYHHLPGKSGLLDSLAERVIEEIAAELAAAGPAPQDWREDVRRRCLLARSVMLRHPWAPGLVSSRTEVPVAAYAHFEALVDSMVRGGLSYHLAHRALHALGSMALGYVSEIFSPAAAGGSTDTEAAEEQLAAMADVFPQITAMVAAELHDHNDPVLGWCDSQSEFEFTLDLLLDGLDRLRSDA